MKHLLLLLLQCLLIAAAYTQGCPPNLDFEKGNLSGWQCAVGTTYSENGNNVISLSPSDPIAGRHEVISAASGLQKDPYGHFPTLCPYGGNFSVKLGNDEVGGEAEGISYTFRIPADVDTLTFTYFYAVVFEDPQHALSDQPRFFVTAYDVATGDVINCASYNYVSTSSLPGFMKSLSRQGVLYKDWSPVSLQFAGLNGREVRLEFKTADCTQGGHFGYAYLDVGTACSNILATAPYCAETNSLILNAPYGFKDYTWFNEDYSKVVGRGQSITLSPPPALTGTFFVDMVPYPGFGCRDTASATVVPLPVPGVPDADPEVFLCQFSTPQPLTAKPLKGHELLWYTSETGGIPSADAPLPSTANADTTEYFVSQKVLFGCESFRRKITVIVRPTPVTAFVQNSTSQCQKGNQFVFTSTSTNLSDAKFLWDFGNGSVDSSGQTKISYSYKQYGRFQVSLTVLNRPVCSSAMTSIVAVVPAPVADFDFPPVICEQETIVVFADKSYVPDNTGTIADWTWNIDGSSSRSRQVTSFVPAHAGTVSVQLAVSTVEGCLSDTLRRQLSIHYRPQAAFSVANALCENEMVALHDRSFLPSDATGEWINVWHWEYDGLPGDVMQHPMRQLAAGTHQIRLRASTNFGCNSAPADTGVLVNPKPDITLQISDSCVFRSIHYTAAYSAVPVAQWYWDTGEGLKPGQPFFSQLYKQEGDRSLVLIGATDKGCKDTVIRPFRIYANHSFAGLDTTVARNQPVYLNAHGGDGVSYQWSPSDGLSDPLSEKPVATLDRDQQYTLYAVTDKGCDSRSKIRIKRYTGPDIYIPNAFTPNSDGNNDALMVVPIGIRSFVYLAVYNRFGQQVFYSTDQFRGWDGMVNGKPQDTGNYIAVSKAIDYAGRVMLRKASVLLLR